MVTIFEKFEIPDPTRPIPEEERGLGPSGELIDYFPEQLKPELIIGKKVDELCYQVGTYGMGGPGFFGLRISNNWLVVALWDAGSWMTAQGRCVQDIFYEDYDRPKPWFEDVDPLVDPLSDRVVGQRIHSVDIQRTSLEIIFADGFDLTISDDPSTRPIMQGSKQPKEFSEEDDLRRAVFLSPTTELWV